MAKREPKPDRYTRLKLQAADAAGFAQEYDHDSFALLAASATCSRTRRPARTEPNGWPRCSSEQPTPCTHWRQRREDLPALRALDDAGI